MGDKRSPTRPKRQPKPSSDEGFWDCSVCTYKNTAEAFKCMMCDVRKGTSTRKPRPVSQLVSQQQVTQQFVLPLQPKKEKKERVEREKSDREPALKKNSHKKMRVFQGACRRSQGQGCRGDVAHLYCLAHLHLRWLQSMLCFLFTRLLPRDTPALHYFLTLLHTHTPTHSCHY
ncbi:YY1-associated factor 2 isoform X2 [Etheostoma cragini]|uniref:YY1-associated factor 2 isoform X2 n=1 Tax=Etheostoma cragini TaxID=417921 RepID=UPI00155E6B41|nr:YY1-associated factor 2 isoform X2 [Etheostoma cragini]